MSLDNLIVNRYLTLEDDEFVLIVDNDIRHFLQNCSENSVLLFPPFNNYRRFLIHKVSETISNEKNNALATFSIGNGTQRRTVVCFRHQLLIDTKNYKLKSSEEAEFSLKYLNRNSVPKYNRKTYLEMGVEGTSSGGFDSAGAKNNNNKQPATRKQKLSEHLAPAEYLDAAACLPSNSQNFTCVNADDSTEVGNCKVIDDLGICGQTEEALKGTSKRIPTSSRTRRPDRAVYVPPRAKRSLTTPPTTSSSSNNQKTNHGHSSKHEAIKTHSKSIDLNENSNSSELNLPSPEIFDPIGVFDGSSAPEQVDSSVIESSCDSHTRSSRNSESLADIGTEFSTKELLQQSPINCDQSIENPSLEVKKEDHKEKTVQKNQKNLTNLHKMSEKSGKKPLTIENAAGLSAIDKEDKEEKELIRASQEINRSNRKLIKQTFNSDVLEIEPTDKQKKPEKLSSPEEEEDLDDWDSKFDDNGDCLDPKMISELTQSVGKVTIEKPKSDYKVYQMKQDLLKGEEFPHVLEVSNFPVEFRTQDLMMLFSPFKESGFDIKWVDDTHALAVFSSAKIAAEVLSLNHSFIKLKPLSEATEISRTKAKKCSNSLQPYRQRPETCAALARRLVTGALGVRLKTAREERENERRVLREAKERKLLAAKQREEIWEG